MQKEKGIKRDRRRKKIRVKITGTKERPRLSVFRSNIDTYIQLIDDSTGKTLINANTKEIKKTKKDKNDKGGKVGRSFELGKLIAKKAIEKKITEVVFDRGGYKYHGRIKAIADGAREGGLKF
jgi:large subunit ribosomal protein L18